MKGISMVLFALFSVARNRVMAPLLMSCSFQPAVAAAATALISRGPRRSTAVVTTATVDSINDWGGKGCNKFVPVLGGDGTKIASTGDIFDQPPDGMS